MRILATHGWLVTFLLILAVPGCGGGDNKTGDGKNSSENKKDNTTTKVDQSSPEKVFESFKKALAAKEWKNVLACVTENSRGKIVLHLLHAVESAVGSDEKRRDSINKIRKKHGILVEGKSSGAFPVIRDKVGLMTDLSSWMEKNPPKTKRESILAEFARTELSKFETVGDKATAVAIRDGTKRPKPFEFEKIDGKWYLEVPGGQERTTKSGPRPFPKIE